jgi:Oxysterol-binding protein
VIGKTTIKNMACPKQSYAVLEFFKRGWSSSSHQKAYGEVFSGNNVVYKIEGRWSESATIVNCKTGEREVVWEKPPYPENWQF